MADRQQPTPGEIVIMAAGAVMLVFSFFNFASDTSSWGSGIFPVATLLALYGLIMAAQIALTRFGGAKMPNRLLGFTWEQVHLALGLMAGLMALGFLLTDISDKQVGLWFEVLGGLALAVGAVMLQRERHTGAIG
jgi:hypothetical protein